MSLSSLIVQRDVATMRQVEEALARQVIYGGDLVTNLLEIARIDEGVLVPLLAEALQLAPAPVGELLPPDDVVRTLMSPEFAVQSLAVPLEVEGDRLLVVVAEPLVPAAREHLTSSVGLDIEFAVAPAVRVWQVLARTYGIQLDRRMQRLVARLAGEATPATGSLPPVARSPGPMTAPGRGLTPVAGRVAAMRPSTPPTAGALAQPSKGAPPLKNERHPTLKNFPQSRISNRPPPLAQGASAVPEGRPVPSTAEHHAGILQRNVSPSMRPSRRRRGPIVLEVARREAEEAVDRDTLLDLYFDFARQFFDYAVLFLVQGDIAEGRDAFGSGAIRERVLGIGVPLDLPGALSSAREKRVPIVTRAADGGLDAVLLSDLQRPRDAEIAVVPLVVRTRAVALLLGDCAESGVDRDAVQQVLACARVVGKGFERIIVRRKLEGFVAGSRTSVEGRVDPSAVPPKVATVPPKSEAPVAPKAAEGKAAEGKAAEGKGTAEPKPKMGSGPRVAAKNKGQPIAEPEAKTLTGLAPRATLEAPAADVVARPPPLPPEVESKPIAGSARPPPLPTDADADAASPAPSAPITEQSMQLGGIESPLPPRRDTPAVVSKPPHLLVAEAAAAAKAALAEASPVEREPQVPEAVVVEHAPKRPPPPTANIASVRPIAYPPIPREEDETSDPPPPPEAVRSASRAPVHAASAAPVRRAPDPTPEAKVFAEAPRVAFSPDVVVVPRHTPGAGIAAVRDVPAAVPTPIARPEAIAASAGSDDDDASAAALFAEIQLAAAKEAEAVEAKKAARRAPAANGESHAASALASPAVVPSSNRPAAAHASESALPSVIVDIEGELAAMVDRVIRGDGYEAAEAELLRQGVRAMPAMMARFPGPVNIDRAAIATMVQPPRASECGPVLRLVARERKVALPSVLDRLKSPDAETRGWAAILLAELPYTEAVEPLVDRLTDTDASIRIAAARALAAIARSTPDAVAGPLRAFARSTDASARAAALRAMGEMREAWVVPDLIAGLRDAAPDVATAAREALILVTRHDFGKEARMWTRWSDHHGKRHRVEWLIDALTNESSDLRRAAAEELRTLSRQYFGYASDAPARDRERAQQRYRDWWITEGRRRDRQF